MIISVEFMTTMEGRLLLILDGFSNIQDCRTDTKTYWGCENRKAYNCHYHIHTCNSASTKTHVMILKQNSTRSTSCSHDIVRTTLRKFHTEVVDRPKNMLILISMIRK